MVSSSPGRIITHNSAPRRWQSRRDCVLQPSNGVELATVFSILFLGIWRWLGVECFEVMVHIDEQFTHDGRKGYLGDFPLGDQPLAKRTKHRLAPSGAQSRHVEGQTDLRAPAPDTAHAFHSTAVSSPGAQAGHSAGFLTVSPPRFLL